MRGQKTVEFRKRRLAADIETVLVYATAPVSRVIGSFSVDRIVTGSPRQIWRQFGHAGEIGRNEFFDYYGDRDTAVAIVVKDADWFPSTIPLDDFVPKPAVPQSFAYMSAEAALSPA